MGTEEEKKYKSDRRQVEKIRDGDEEAFEQLFFAYFYDLCLFAISFTGSKEQARDIVQDVFYQLWKHRKKWRITGSLKAYLFNSVRNKSLNHIDKEQHRLNIKKEYLDETSLYSDFDRDERTGELTADDRKLVRQIWEIALQMPRRRRSVFILHRRHGLTYREISGVMNISRKTVENHMGLALDEIRKIIDDKPH